MLRLIDIGRDREKKSSNKLSAVVKSLIAKTMNYSQDKHLTELSIDEVT